MPHSNYTEPERQLLILTSVILVVSYLAAAYTPYYPVDLDDLEALDSALENSYDVQEYPSADKRYARLSYSFGSRGYTGGRRRNRYYSSRYYRSRYYRNYYKPWLNLPDTDCFRQRCSTDEDCCRGFSKCDKDAKICYNCWHGYPCSSSRDCCERYPYCNEQARMCQT